MAKMVVVRDTERNSYLKMNFVEFLEFLCRISLILFPDDNLLLTEKVKLMLRKLIAS